MTVSEELADLRRRVERLENLRNYVLVGEWKQDIRYLKWNRVVHYGKGWYAAVNLPLEAPATGSEWVSDDGSWKGDWNASADYALYDLVRHDGKFWTALRANPGQPGERLEDWQEYKR
jgi:hypothetical protein